MNKDIVVCSCFFISLFLVICGCISQYSIADNSNASKFAESANFSQRYYDDLILSDQFNATTWIIRGNYYNDVFNQYETALQSYSRALELDPENGYAWIK